MPEHMKLRLAGKTYELHLKTDLAEPAVRMQEMAACAHDGLGLGLRQPQIAPVHAAHPEVDRPRCRCL